MAHLRKRPTYFVKDGVRREAFFTIQARELREQGFVEEGAELPKPPVVEKKLPEVAVEVGGDAFDFETAVEVVGETLDDMTKVELVEYAEEHGLEFKPNQPKAEILQICKDHEGKA